MKKFLVLAVAAAMTLSLAACGKAKPEPAVTNADGTPKAAFENKASSKQIGCRIEGTDLIFTVSRSLPLGTDAWIGICEKGDYVLEDDADDAGVTYSYFEERETEDEDYVFKVGTEGLEDALYTMVLCDTENGGYVMASWSMTLKDGKPSADLSDLRFNQKPSNIPAPKEPAEQVDPDETDIDEDYDGDYPGDDEDEPDDGAPDA